ncbi:hypothetical protein HDU93_005634, partial [Gonapodya sp. JEL0774]
SPSVNHLTPHTTHPSRPVIDLPSLGRAGFRVTSMCAAAGVVLAGGMEGNFAVRRWTEDDEGSTVDAKAQEECDEVEDDEWWKYAGGTESNKRRAAGPPIGQRPTPESIQSSRSTTDPGTITTGFFNSTSDIVNSMNIVGSRSG